MAKEPKTIYRVHTSFLDSRTFLTWNKYFRTKVAANRYAKRMSKMPFVSSSKVYK